MSVEQERERSEAARAQGTVAPFLPLALLESIRVHDRPREVLEEEDLSTSLPRRLGLTGVIESQIRRYEEAARKSRNVPAEEVLDLLRLILRRPDAEPILREAGARVTRRHARRGGAPRTLLRLLPRAATAAAVRRAARRLLRRLRGSGRPEVSGRPMQARLRGAITAAVGGDGTACVFYAAALEELVFRYMQERPRIAHTRCEARGDDLCEWTVEE